MGVSRRAIGQIERDIRGDGEEKFKRIFSLIIDATIIISLTILSKNHIEVSDIRLVINHSTTANSSGSCERLCIVMLRSISLPFVKLNTRP